MNRRTILTAALAALAAPALAAPAVASTDTPVMALFRQWEVASNAEDAAYDRDCSDAEGEALSGIRSGIERRMMAEPCRAPQDFICKVVAYTSYGMFALEDQQADPDLWASAPALIGPAYGKAWRAAQTRYKFIIEG